MLSKRRCNPWMPLTVLQTEFLHMSSRLNWALHPPLFHTLHLDLVCGMSQDDAFQLCVVNYVAAAVVGRTMEVLG
jgi:hypothetical protein